MSNFLRVGAEGKDKKPKLGEMVSFELSDPVRLGNKIQAVRIRPSTASYVVQDEAVEPVAVVTQNGAIKVGV